MTETPTSTPNPRFPGNDGSWFLEAIGVTAPGSAEPQTDGDDPAAADTELWSTPPDAFTGWQPEDVSPVVDKTRSFRVPALILAVLAAIALAVFALWLPGTSSRRADAVATDYSDALGDIRTALPATQQVLEEVTEPSADATQFPDLLPTLAELEAAAATALALAAEPLPEPWPLAPSAPFDELQPFRDAVSVEAASADAIQRQIGDVLEYRMTAAGILDTGELPANADQLDELNARLAETATETAGIIADLPDDAAFVEHKEAAQTALERFFDWQVSYVDALRTESTDLVASHIDEMAEAKAQLDRLLVNALAQIRSDIDEEIIALAAALDETIVALSE
jgi:hypothetical protein